MEEDVTENTENATEKAENTTQNTEKTFTPQEMLNEINKAIYTVLVGGQSYKIGTRQLTRADLKQLYEMKNEFEAQVNADSDSELFHNTYVARFEGR